jgi:hypothetical protein
MPFISSTVWPSTAVCVYRPASAICSARVVVVEVPVCSQRADALAAARSAVQAAAAALVRSAEAAQLRCAAADDSSPVAADLVPDDSLAARLAAPSKDALPARAALLADSCPDGCRPAHYSAPDGSAEQRASGHCAPVALRDGYPACYSEMVDSAEGDSPDWAGSLQAGSVAVGWAAACCSAHLVPADYWAAQTLDDRSVPVARTDGWLQAADDFPADSVADDSPVDWVVDDCRVGSVPADYSAWRDSPALAVPQVGSSQGAHSQADFPASCSADCLGDSWLQAMALASPVEQ